jgi:hypothetical protein
VSAPVIWQATGGTILSDGRFSSASAGSFMVTGTTRHLTEERVDTAYVKVVLRHPHLNSIEVAPDSVTLAPGVSQTFLVIGRLKDGHPVPVGVTWTASGGTIDAGGNFVAGDTAGTYQVIATNTIRSLSDTAVVTITAPAPPPPPAPAPPPEEAPEEPAPVLEKVTLMPASATLAPTATRQFTAYGRTTTGDSVSVDVVFAATGGTITQGGLYTAGSTAGSYRIIATSGSLADTSSLTVTSPLGSGPAAGIPYGPFGSFATTTQLKPNTETFTLTLGPTTASNIVTLLAAARAAKIKMILAMTGGSHSNYLTDGVFDYTKWKAKMDTYNTAAIRDAVAKAVADGTILGNFVMDEPNVSGGGDGNTWGPKGTMTKARVDGMCGYVKAMFPTLPVGVAHNHNTFEPDQSYTVCEFLIDQYAYRKGSVTTFRDEGLALGQRDNIAIIFSLNTLSGGIQAARDGLWYCDPETTGGRGTFDPTCRMTPEQIREFGRVLGPAGCALLMWRYDDVMMQDLEYQRAFRDVAAMLATAPAKSCSRG